VWCVVYRTRDADELAQCDVVVDVGGVYDADSHRYDHHQRYATPLHSTPLRSAPLHIHSRLLPMLVSYDTAGSCVEKKR